MPEHLASAFTRCGSIRVGEYFVDETFNGKPRYVFPRADVDRFVADVTARFSGSGRWGGRVQAVMTLLRRLDVAGKRVVVFGSTEPLYEAALVVLGAQHVTTGESVSVVLQVALALAHLPGALMQLTTRTSHSSIRR
jgi:hypothetical protein